MKRIHNFSAGPAALPLEVLEQAQQNFVNYKGSGTSIIEKSHHQELHVNFSKRPLIHFSYTKPHCCYLPNTLGKIYSTSSVDTEPI